jgi:hypothetical protein
MGQAPREHFAGPRETHYHQRSRSWLPAEMTCSSCQVDMKFRDLPGKGPGCAQVRWECLGRVLVAARALNVTGSAVARLWASAPFPGNFWVTAPRVLKG